MSFSDSIGIEGTGYSKFVFNFQLAMSNFSRADFPSKCLLPAVSRVGDKTPLVGVPFLARYALRRFKPRFTVCFSNKRHKQREHIVAVASEIKTKSSAAHEEATESDV